jgi:spore germination cell wall hydrolase CwlJ-like protein
MAELIIGSMMQFGIMVQNTYFEAQGESFEGKVSVNQVVIQRMFERNMSAHDVIYQRHQFSWLWDDIPDIVRDLDMLNQCMLAVTEAYNRRMNGDNFYHANLYHASTMPVYPSWASHPKVKRLIQVDKHIYYREPWKTSNHWTLAEDK